MHLSSQESVVLKKTYNGNGLFLADSRMLSAIPHSKQPPEKIGYLFDVALGAVMN
jgi:hypothetical protein